MSKTSIIAPSNYLSLIQQGIVNAKGSKEAINFITEDDLKDLGKILADREAKIDGLFSIVVDPINDIALAIQRGNYTSVSPWINDGHTPLQEASDSKRIYFVPVPENLNTGDEEAYVKKFGLILFEKVPNYLFGTMAALSKDKILEGLLKDKKVVAMGNDSASVFKAVDDYNDRAFLSVDCCGGKRELCLISVGSCWTADKDQMFLAEKP